MSSEKEILMSDKDDELDKLLGELANAEPLAAVPEKKSQKNETIEIAPAPRKKIEVSIEDEIETNLADDDSSQLADVFSDQLKSVASKYGSVFKEIIANYQKDREQAQEVIDRFMDVICTGGKVPRIYLEKVADAVRAKNEIAQTAIRALDSLPKLISATKGNEMFNSSSGMSFDAKHLKDILEAAKKDDE